MSKEKFLGFGAQMEIQGNHGTYYRGKEVLQGREKQGEEIQCCNPGFTTLYIC